MDVLRRCALKTAVMIGALAALALSAERADGMWPCQGPWKAQIVDAETGLPIEGVIVLAVWYKQTRNLAGPVGDFYAAEELVTGPDGRFEIQRRCDLFTVNPLTYIDKAWFAFYRPGEQGYGPLTVRQWGGPSAEDVHTADLLLRDGVVFAARSFRTSDERRKHYDYLSSQLRNLIPREFKRRMETALEQERRQFGNR
jgi:hypothetical protein